MKNCPVLCLRFPWSQKNRYLSQAEFHLYPKNLLDCCLMNLECCVLRLLMWPSALCFHFPAPRDPKLCFSEPLIFFLSIVVAKPFLLSIPLMFFSISGRVNRRKGCRKAFVNCCCCEREVPVELLVQSVVHIFRKAAFQNFPTTGCTSGSTERIWHLWSANRAFLFWLLLVSSFLCLLRGTAPQ